MVNQPFPVEPEPGSSEASVTQPISAAGEQFRSESEKALWVDAVNALPAAPPLSSSKVMWGMVLASFGLHALLLLFPIPDKPKAPTEPAEPQEKQVRITQLPTQAKPTTARAKPSTPKPKPAAVPRRVNPRSSTLAVPRPRPASPAAVPPTQTLPTPIASPPAEPPQPAQKSTSWQDFPQYPGAQSGCYELQSCFQTGRSLSEVAAFFSQQLAAKKYQASPTITEADRQVFQVSKDGITQFLSLINVPEGTLYVLAEAPRTVNDLMQAIEVPADIYGVLLGLAAEDATRDLFAQADPFFAGTDARPEIGIMKLVTGEDPATFFDTYFRTNLLNSGFQSSESPQQYAGGLLYEVKKENTSLYINLVPTKDGTGTIVVIWKNLPQ